MKNIKSIVIILNLILLIGYINWAIFSKEKTLTEGILMLFELAPVDPRSLMQGDFMILRYGIARQMRNDSLPKKGYAIVTLDQNNVAKLVRVVESITPLGAEEFSVKYSTSTSGVSIGADSYFFEEGTGKRYEDAKYGGVRVDESGKSILVGLYGKAFELIEK